MKKRKETKKINPMLGLLGFGGLIGVAGFPVYNRTGMTFPFLFFALFGMFGFFYEGKMSKTFMDERYMEDRMKAENKALSMGFKAIFAGLLILSIIENRIVNKNIVLIGIEIFVSLMVGFVIFTIEYLTYKYDFDEESEEED